MAPAELVPYADNISEVYVDPSTSEQLDPALSSRWTTFITHFKQTYGASPDFVARSPGRVNIIGEHIDYSLYNVLPTAVTVDALIAVKVLDPANTGKEAFTVKVANLNPEKYPTRTFTVGVKEEVEIDASKHEWTNYFLAGLRGALRFLRKEKGEGFVPRGLEVVMDGNVPAGGGLSSSAALVCASTLAVMKANDHEVSKEDLLDLAIVSERAVGVYSGGMDQAASIFSKRGYLLYCTFFPEFAAEHVPVPKPDPEITFLIAQSFVTSDKHVTAPRCYNLRVVECTLATVVLAKILDIVLNPDKSSLGFSLRNLQEELMRKEGKLDNSFEAQLDHLISVIDSRLSQQSGYTREDISSILGVSVENLEKEYMSKFPVEADKFMLRQRALHVVQEARRVTTFKSILSGAEEGGQGLKEDKIQQLAKLMNETQDSCRDVYECSCPELDEICGIVRKAGGYGSRLTGAGAYKNIPSSPLTQLPFLLPCSIPDPQKSILLSSNLLTLILVRITGWGGCTVHLVPQSKLATITDALKKEYYFKKFPDISEERLRQAIVVSKPSQGSFVIGGKALEV